MNIKKTLLLPIIFGLASGPVLAGEELSEEGILLEISFLAKKLLDMTSQESYSVNQPAYTKAFIGICTSMTKQGVLLTCVTPGTEAEKAGLRTGDVLTQINGKRMPGIETKEAESAYWSSIKKMKVGDVLKVSLIRDKKTITMDVGVGELSHPKYTLTINK